MATIKLAAFLTTPIAESKSDQSARPRLTRDGYTVRGGSPTTTMIRLQGETRWRRLMVWQFSNSGTCFVRVKGESLIVRDTDIPTPSARPLPRVYCTTYCNHGHRVADGKPIGHECKIIPPAALKAEIEDRIPDAITIMSASSMPSHRGVRS